MIKITGTNTYIDVEIDGRTARISGEMIIGGFVCYKSSMTNWLIPENEPLTEEDKKEIIQKVTEKTAGSHMVITFDENESMEKVSNENQASMEKEVSIEARATSEKYISFMKPIVNELVALLKKLNEMIETQFKKDSENGRLDRDSFDEFCKNYKEVITPFCTEAFLKKWYRNSVRQPGDYYILNENANIYFTMKSEAKALVFIEPASEGAGGNYYKFELKNENGKYLIDKMFYYFKSENIFHRMHWL